MIRVGVVALGFSLPYFFHIYFQAITFSNFSLSIIYLNIRNMKYFPCNTVFSLASSTMSSAYFTVRITCPILKSPKALRIFQINQPTRCYKFSSLLLDIYSYVQLNMFPASSRPSSGTQQLQ